MQIMRVAGSLKQRIASMLFPRYSHILQKINLNAQLMSWYQSKKNDIRLFIDTGAYFEFISTIIGNEKVTFLEFGVYNGNTIKNWVKLNLNQESRFYGFDSFEGLPEDWNKGLKKGDFSLEGNAPQINDIRVTLVKGLFQQTLHDFLLDYTPDSKHIIHIDSDLYTSAIFVLSNVDKILRLGDIIMFDEFGSPDHEFKAFIDYTTSFKRTLKPFAAIEKLGIPEKVAFEVT